jgi:hypothetical protein
MIAITVLVITRVTQWIPPFFLVLMFGACCCCCCGVSGQCLGVISVTSCAEHVHNGGMIYRMLIINSALLVCSPLDAHSS